MPRPRKRHVQEELAFSTWGGKRKGAGRPAKGPRASEQHKKRPPLRPGSVLLVTMRAAEGTGNLRRPEGYHAIRRALYAVVERENFRIVHVSIQHNHVHMIVEADSREAMSRGMQAFEISAARHLNASIQLPDGSHRDGEVFDDRFHERLLSSPRQVRNAIAYVLNNWRRHGEDRRHPARKVDAYSSGITFNGWKEREDALFLFTPPRGYIPLTVSLPTTWLLRVGWMKWGKISEFEVPGPKEKRAVFGR